MDNLSFDPRAMLRRAMGTANQEIESPMEELGEVAEGPSEDEKYKHHAKMARKAASPAARKLHQKMMAHHKNKLK